MTAVIERPSVVAVLRELRHRGLTDARDGDHAWTAQCPVCRSYGIDAATLRITERVEDGPAQLACRNRCADDLILGALELGTNGNGASPSEIGRSITTRPLSDYAVEPVDWLWRKRIPCAELTVVGGDGGLGKSTFLAYLAGRVTRGEITGLNGTGRVLVVLGEDNPARVLRARYDAAGADMAKVEILAANDECGEEMPVLPDDLPRIREAVERLRPDLLVVDPLSAYLGASVDSHRDGGRGGLRAVLGPLSHLAHTTGTTVCVVAHYNKGNGPASQRLGGTAALRNAARNVLAFARHPNSRGEDGQDDDDDGRRIIGHEKCNVGHEQASLAATIRQVPILKADGTPLLDKDGDAATTSALDVGDLSDVGYEDALTAATNNRQEEGERDALAEAIDFIRAELADGPVPSRELDRSAADAGIAKRTLMRARKQLGVKATKTATGWTVSVPGTVGSLGTLDRESPVNAGDSKDATPAPPGTKAANNAKGANNAAPREVAALAPVVPLRDPDQLAARNGVRADLGLAARCACPSPLPAPDTEDGSLRCARCGREAEWGMGA